MSDNFDEVVKQAKIVGFNKARVAISEVAIETLEYLESCDIQKGTSGEIYLKAVTETLNNIQNALIKAEKEL